DVIASAFDSAGQRCSALRILCLQDEIADRTLAMLKGALKELRIGRTDRLAIDIGPVITAEAKAGIEAHIDAMRALGRPVEQLELPAGTAHGTFVPPTIVEIESIADVPREVFGPVLHVIRYRREGIAALVDAINATGYGLTFGLHTRLDETVARVTRRIRAGNIYVNRNVIGAVVGVQPFGGRGLSGTGPKAGGPLYLGRLVTVPPDLERDSGQADPALCDFADWLDGMGENEAAMMARRQGERSALGLERELAGPVGERNVYTLHPRGLVLLKPATRHGLFRQMAAVLATGNQGVIEDMPVPSGLPQRVADRFAGKADGAVGAVLLEGDSERIVAVAKALAERPGAVAPIYVLDERSAGYPLIWLLEEVSTSINTTAAGGNASLMMIG
ncbi:MAG TPA: aldehyde dehydrogenase family protein, partial [Sphingobium sp.]